MNDVSQKLWVVAAGILAAALIIAGLIFGFSRNNSATQVTETTTQQEKTQTAKDSGKKDSGKDKKEAAKADDKSGNSDAKASAAGAASADANANADSEDVPTSAIDDTGSFGSEAFDVKSGEELFAAACQSCHQAGGVGAENGAGHYPALANNERLKDPNYPMAFILNGAGAMPSFAGTLTDDQVAMVVNYLRNDLNNFDGTVKPEEVAPIRPDKQTDLGSDAG